MGRRRGPYPEHGPDGLKGSKKRNHYFRLEAEALGDTRQEHVPVGDDDTRVMHGRKIRSGTRPYLRVDVDGPWGPFLTDRQKKRRAVKTARAWGRMNVMLEQTGMSLEEFVQQLTPEELVRGKLRDKNGGFVGRTPSWVPAEFHRACIRELMRRGKEMWQLNYLDAITAMTAIAKGEVKGATAGDRLRAAQFVVERLEGKTPEIVLVGHDEPWQVVIDDIVAQVPDEQIAAAKAARYGQAGLPQDVVDAEIVSEVEEPSDAPPPPPVRRRAPARRRRT